MKKQFLLLIAPLAFMFCGITSCGWFEDGWLKIPGITSPIHFGIKYQLEDNLYLVVVTGTKGGFEIKLEGEGGHVKAIPGGYEFTSSDSNLIYRVTTDDKGEIYIYIVSADGKLQPYNVKSM